ncbi:MAG TPA: 2'-5' RNA ligase family protein [Gemmataceae bacterium]|nr:2'-5' RNA ligase family protein [Gemmataceae bacterium]
MGVASGMSVKSHRTAVVLIPPPEVWGPIQVIRQQHDRQFRRWMPHVNLLYPFYQQERFAEAASRLAAVCAAFAPFAVTLAEFRFFRHPSGRATLWLRPEPTEPLVRLQAALQAACPACDDQSRFPTGFTPHLSVGQARSAAEAQRLRDHWQARWQPIRFEVTAITLIRRDPNGPFVIDRSIPLAAGREEQNG